jgi:hypothetical protein
MQLHTGTSEKSSGTGQGLQDAGRARRSPLAEINRWVRATPAPVPRSAPCLPIAGEQSEPAPQEIDRWELLERCYRDHMARCALEEMFAAGEMGAFGE